ncbi:11372_t:CDS:2 [Acaulospora colombiana]|uniref:11372_t:CDS:1 n=1 Tax=Acaulospora colombiana TaxID=27376 RepID=A0ACA9LBS9_9GLOM|nr:11372_t:CDS:2 [Acaulospora colombiana]
MPRAIRQNIREWESYKAEETPQIAATKIITILTKGAQQATISGTLHIRYTEEKPIFAKKIEVSFVGKEYVFFRGTVLESRRTEDDEVLNDEDPGAEISEDGSYEGVKSLDLPFTFKLPDNLPPSVCMDKGCGRIYYTLKAVISRQPINPDSNKRKKVIKLVVPIVRHTITPPPTPCRWLVKKEGPAITHAVCYDVSLDRVTFRPGDTVTVPIKLHLRESYAYLKEIFVGIKEYHELRTNEYETTTKKYIVDKTISAESIPIADGPDNEMSVNVKFEIPHQRNLVYNVDTTYLTVTHKFKVKLRLGQVPDIHLRKAINVENIVSSEEVPILLPPRVKTIESIKPLVSLPRLPDKKDKRVSPFLPFFSKIHTLDPVTRKRISIQLLQIVDSKNPNLVYNSRSLAVSR